MKCSRCGAVLRPNARFCNVCGKVVASGLTPGAQPAGAVASSADTNGNGARTPGAGSVAVPANPQPVPQTQPIVDAEAPVKGVATTVHLDAHVNRAPGGGHRYNPSSQPLHLVADPSGSGGQQPRPDDQLSWPLPDKVILDGRYRVEGLLHGGDESNTYRVSDLRGYERCWNCGTAYGADAASERFCANCGADMLARDLVMHERRLMPAELPQAEAAAAASAALDPTTADMAAPRLFIQSGRAFRVEPRAPRAAAFPRGPRLLAGAATDLGLSRTGAHEENEDSALVLILDRFHESLALPCGLFAVADGMGGHASGQKASRLAITVLAHTIMRQLIVPSVGPTSSPPREEEQIAALLRDAMRNANNALCKFNQENELDAGCTAVAVLISGETAHIANVGDSRCYVLDDSGLRRLTVDHSLVQQLVAAHMIEPDEVYTHPQRNQIFRSFGDEVDLQADLFVQRLAPGMRLLLCCDGVWEMVRDNDIERILRTAPDPQTACDALVEAANKGGGEDNITAVVIEAR